MTATERVQFKVGDRVKDKRDGAIGTLIELRRHTNGSPKWLVQFDASERQSQSAGRYWTWQVDLRPVDQ